MDNPFWEETYRIDEVSTFGTGPNRAVEALWETFDKNAAILEVGCGEGKNLIFLAEKGFTNLHAFDKSQAGIDKVNRIAEKKGLQIHAWVQDLTDFVFSQRYGVIICYGTLHFVSKDEWKKFIIDAKENTNVGGLNIFHIFTNTVPASPDIAPFVRGLADEGELVSIYQDRDWEIVLSDSHIFEDEHPGVEKHFHAVNVIGAKRIQ